MQLSPMARVARYALLAAVPIAFMACDDDDPNDDNLFQDDTLREVLRGSDYEELEDRIDEYDDLVNVLDDASRTLTLFAPTDAALAAVEIDTFSSEAREDILTYHLLDTTILASSIPTGYTVTPTSLTGTAPNGADISVVIVNDAGSISVNGVPVTNADADNVNNGVIHTIDGVLTPPSITDFVVDLNDFSALESALTSVDPGFDYVSTLDGNGPFTVFAPLNSGLMLPDSISTPEQIGSVLGYHVVPAFVLSSSITDTTSVTTVNGADLRVAPSDNGVVVIDEFDNAYEIVEADIIATNGVIHAIDGVLLPDDAD